MEDSWLEDMPDPGSPFVGWLNRQISDPAVRDAGDGDGAGQPEPVSTSGAFAPSISDFSYDLPSMIGGVRCRRTQGRAQSTESEQAQKRLNYGRDVTARGLGNNMLSWMTGGQATDPVRGSRSARARAAR